MTKKVKAPIPLHLQALEGRIGRDVTIEMVPHNGFDRVVIGSLSDYGDTWACVKIPSGKHTYIAATEISTITI